MNFKVIGLATLCLALALPVMGQGPRGFRGGPPTGGPGEGEGPQFGDPDPLGRLTEALDLTASQVASLEALFEQRKSSQETYREQIRASRDAVQSAIESRDPTAVGNAVLAQRGIEEELRQINEAFMADFRNLLTPGQQDQLDVLEAFGRGGVLGPGRGRPGGRGAPGPGRFRELGGERSRSGLTAPTGV